MGRLVRLLLVDPRTTHHPAAPAGHDAAVDSGGGRRSVRQPRRPPGVRRGPRARVLPAGGALAALVAGPHAGRGAPRSPPQRAGADVGARALGPHRRPSPNRTVSTGHVARTSPPGPRSRFKPLLAGGDGFGGVLRGPPPRAGAAR